MLIGNAAGYSELDKLTATFGNDINLFCNVDSTPAQFLDPKTLAPGLGELIRTMVDRYQAKRPGTKVVPMHVTKGFNHAWVLLNNVLPIAKEKYGGFDPEAVRKAALDVDIPDGGTIQGHGVKFYPPGTPLAGQNERSTPVVMQYNDGQTTIVWPSNIRTHEPVLPLPGSSPYAMR
jgi:branched-chain amino acid transport system substrate-binding protein